MCAPMSDVITIDAMANVKMTLALGMDLWFLKGCSTYFQEKYEIIKHRRISVTFPRLPRSVIHQYFTNTNIGQCHK